jgi:hypothetical protein
MALSSDDDTAPIKRSLPEDLPEPIPPHPQQLERHVEGAAVTVHRNHPESIGRGDWMVIGQ